MTTEASQVQIPPIEKGVKLLYKEGYDYKSYCAPVAGAIIYPIGKWVGPKTYCGPLTIFDTIENARRYLDLMGNYFPYWLFTSEYILSQYTVLWSGCAGKIYGPPYPTGTRLADKVKILNLIESR